MPHATCRMLPRTEPTCRKQEHNYEYHKRTTHKRRHRDRRTGGRADGQGDRQTDRARMAEGQTGCWQRTERDRRGADKTKAQDTHPATHCSSSHKEREREMEREGEGDREREWEKDKDCARSRPPHGCCPVSNCISCFISLSRGNRHCLLLYGRAKRREQGKEGDGGEATVRVMRCWRVC